MKFQETSFHPHPRHYPIMVEAHKVAHAAEGLRKPFDIGLLDQKFA